MDNENFLKKFSGRIEHIGKDGVYGIVKSAHLGVEVEKKSPRKRNKKKINEEQKKEIPSKPTRNNKKPNYFSDPHFDKKNSPNRKHSPKRNQNSPNVKQSYQKKKCVSDLNLPNIKKSAQLPKISNTEAENHRSKTKPKPPFNRYHSLNEAKPKVGSEKNSLKLPKIPNFATSRKALGRYKDELKPVGNKTRSKSREVSPQKMSQERLPPRNPSPHRNLKIYQSGHNYPESSFKYSLTTESVPNQKRIPYSKTLDTKGSSQSFSESISKTSKKNKNTQSVFDPKKSVKKNYEQNIPRVQSSKIRARQPENKSMRYQSPKSRQQILTDQNNLRYQSPKAMKKSPGEKVSLVSESSKSQIQTQRNRNSNQKSQSPKQSRTTRGAEYTESKEKSFQKQSEKTPQGSLKKSVVKVVPKRVNEGGNKNLINQFKQDAAYIRNIQKKTDDFIRKNTAELQRLSKLSTPKNKTVESNESGKYMKKSSAFNGVITEESEGQRNLEIINESGEEEALKRSQGKPELSEIEKLILQRESYQSFLPFNSKFKLK